MKKEFKKYKRKGLSEMRPYVEGEDLTAVSVSDEDFNAGSPKEGDMIARNPNNHDDKWLVAKKYFEDNLEILEDTPETVEVPRDLLEGLLENSNCLRGEWTWRKEGEVGGNREIFNGICQEIEQTEKLLK